VVKTTASARAVTSRARLAEVEVGFFYNPAAARRRVFKRD
jgi:hypothetical protein